MRNVSVIIPFYNNKEFLIDTINSVLSQTYRDVEIVLIDDASKDDVYEFVRINFRKEIEKGKVIVFRNKNNLERCISRNIGAYYSKGEYLFFLDHDDMYEKDYIESVLPYFNDYDIVYSIPRRFVDSENRIIRYSRKKFGKMDEEIFSGNIGYTIGIGVKKSVFSGFKNEFLMREDWEFFIRNFLEGKKIKILDNDKIIIREHKNRTSNNIKLYLSTLNIMKTYYDKIDDHYKPFILFHTGEIALRFGRKKEGLMYIKDALKIKNGIIFERRRLTNLIKWGIMNFR
uniref:Glycosyltransferase family 2 protein n=1 Tax=candidate division WOR-3 bacterium TaxID=2052148 RepID=A0A7C4U6N6_UNCW3